MKKKNNTKKQLDIVDRIADSLWMSFSFADGVDIKLINRAAKSLLRYLNKHNYEISLKEGE